MADFTTTPPHPSAPRALVLLAAGQGSRLRPLTETTPKSMLDIGGKTILETILDPLLEEKTREIVIVTGFEGDQLSAFIETAYPGKNIRTVRNARYAEDTNILSTQIGVEALRHPERGYFIIETDIIAPAHVWSGIVAQEDRLGSFWVTHDRYNPGLTGGIVNVDATGKVTDIRYEHDYNERFEGWPKMLGVLSVGPGEVAEDRRTRATLAARSFSQYYMQPWIENASRLPCQTYDLGRDFAMSFNTQDAFETAKQAFGAQNKS